MRFFSGKSLVILGFVLVLLVGIPSTIYLVQQQQDLRSHAEKTSNLTVKTDKSTVAVGDEITATITLDPGQNFVTYLNVELLYDKSKLQVASPSGYTPNATAFPIPVRGPTYSDGKVEFSLQSSATDVTRTIRTVTTVATIRFKAIAATAANTPAFITFGSGSQAYSAGGTANGGVNDAYNENVLTGQYIPANITITDASTSPSPSIIQPTPTPIGGTSGGGTATAPTPTAPPSQQVTNPSPTAIANQPPVCQSLNIDRAATGTAPYDVALTATGNDADGNVAQVTFQFGDGPVENVTNGGGIGTSSVSVQKTHTYHNPGTYQAYAILTDNQGAISTMGQCQLTVNVTAAGAAAPGTSTTVSSSGSSQTTNTTTTTTTGGTGVSQGTSNAGTATLPNTGPNNLMIGLGAIGGGVTLIGLILFFAL